MNCKLCQQIMECSIIRFPDSHYFYNHYRCKSCAPEHQTYYLVISNIDNTIIVEQIQIDEICVDQHPSSIPPFTDIFVNNKLACTLDKISLCGIISPETFKSKIKNYIVFS